MIYISIESRKGGVGKTTVSLSIAEILIQKGYHVLLVDMDIVGTRIDNTFLNANKDKIHVVTRNGKTVNLIELFKTIFMVGKKIPAFEHEDSTSNNCLTFQQGKCNIVGSNIYGEKTGAGLLEDPRILYDAIHSYWLLELVKGLAQSFATAVGVNEKVAIILDNSPGYSSLEKVSNDYLTDLGPERGKILFVSTMDPQDLAACKQSLAFVQELYKDKVAACKYYWDHKNRGSKIKSEAFDSIWNSLCASDGKEPVYYSEVHDVQPTFASILVNKVPRNIYEQLYIKKLLDRQKEPAVPFLNHMLYFFSNQLLEENGIQHRISLGFKTSDYCLSGKVESMKEDDEKYQKLRTFAKEYGLRDFFREEWAPQFPFKSLIDYFRDQEILKDVHVRELTFKDLRSHDMQNRIDSEVQTVKNFILNNLSPTSKLLRQLDAISEYITKILRSAEGQNEIVFLPESNKFVSEEKFVVLFGLAVYSLHNYETACGILNELIKVCLEDINEMETLDLDDIDRRVTDIMEGRRMGIHLEEEMEKYFTSHKNARELEAVIDQTIKSWGL